jgi:hypothetical protein
MTNTVLENLQATLEDLRTELVVTNDPAKREDVQRLIQRFEAVVDDAKGMGSLQNL